MVGMGRRTPAAEDPSPVTFTGIGVLADDAVLLYEADGSVARGEILAVTGPNGSGKTTLLRVLAGIIAPTAGQVRILGRRPEERERRFRAALAALIGPPQTARDLTIAEHLQFVAATWGTSAAAAREHAGALLEEFAITPLAGRFPHELSSGQSQLVAIALTLARPAQVLVLDEPEQRLDPDRLAMVIDALQARADDGAAITIATHSPRLTDELADTRLHLEAPA